LNAQDLLDRAQRAVESAKLLLDAGDVNGACNRAYYAMFDAARAALIATQKPPESEAIKTHSGLISAFSLHLVKTGHVSVELGKSFSKVADIRLVADYSDEEVSPDRASGQSSRREPSWERCATEPRPRRKSLKGEQTETVLFAQR
jgi:uncharacterized protein (UPF0332 family)